MGPSDQTEPNAVAAVGAVVIAADGRVLLVRRGKAPSYGEWSLVGGRVEPDEPLADAVRREVLEETAVRVRVVAALEIVHVAREGYAYAIHEFLCVPESDPACAVAGSDALEVTWARPSELAALGVRDDARAVVARAFERLGEGRR